MRFFLALASLTLIAAPAPAAPATLPAQAECDALAYPYSAPVAGTDAEATAAEHAATVAYCAAPGAASSAWCRCYAAGRMDGRFASGL